MPYDVLTCECLCSLVSYTRLQQYVVVAASIRHVGLWWDHKKFEVQFFLRHPIFGHANVRSKRHMDLGTVSLR